MHFYALKMFRTGTITKVVFQIAPKHQDDRQRRAVATLIAAALFLLEHASKRWRISRRRDRVPIMRQQPRPNMHPARHTALIADKTNLAISKPMDNSSLTRPVVDRGFRA